MWVNPRGSAEAAASRSPHSGVKLGYIKVDHRSMAATMRRPMRNATEISDGSHAPTTAAAVDGAALRAAAVAFGQHF